MPSVTVIVLEIGTGSLELEKEADELRAEIEKLRAILADVKLLHKVVCDELLAVAKDGFS